MESFIQEELRFPKVLLLGIGLFKGYQDENMQFSPSTWGCLVKLPDWPLPAADWVSSQPKREESVVGTDHSGLPRAFVVDDSVMKTFPGLWLLAHLTLFSLSLSDLIQTPGF